MANSFLLCKYDIWAGTKQPCLKAVQKIKTVTWHLSWPYLALKKILNKTPQFSQAQNGTSTPNQPHQIAPGRGQSLRRI